ncbi:MAG: 2-oxoglutarate dehydrogenase complex dihydrolipoyllysine-residue succinyltransferase [Pseudomonadota bacterium]|nr:2-oxoglutarate dehydrogenase complex dihydrolipoyllysine-residue succinyltransferase [Pseudomonadota bacterium]
MMLVEVKVPVLSESVAEATLLSWHKKAGEYVQRDENLIDVETDKVVLELPAPAAGLLKQIIKSDGATVGSDDVIATIDTEAIAPAPGKAKAGDGQVAREGQTPAEGQKRADGQTSAAAKPQAKGSKGKQQADEPVLMPAAKKAAADRGIDTSEFQGTGRGGRVTKDDVLNQDRPAQADARPARQPDSGASAAAKPLDAKPAPAGERPETRAPMSRLRARIAERLVQSQATAAILTTFNEVNMQPVIELRNRYKDKFEKEHGVKLGFMSFFVKASVAALKKFPVVNASIDGKDIVYHGYFDIGIAVGTPRGLVVPIVRDADQLSLAEIEKQIAEFGKRAQDGKLTLEELTGGTFSISNGGVFGSMLSTPIINPPQSAILGVHATKERAVVENGQIVVRPMNYLALSYDHRIIDGREAVLALVAIKDALEDPARMLLDI